MDTVRPPVDQRGYHKLQVTGHWDPLTTATTLAACGRFGTYVVYERNGEWWFAGGALGEVRVDWQSVQWRWGDAWTTERWSGDPLEALQNSLSQIPFSPWRMFGWMAFEAAYPILGLERPAGSEGLLAYLMIPHTVARISPDNITLLSADRETLLACWDVIDTPTPDVWHQARAVDVSVGAAAYQETVDAAVGRILNGEFDKVVLSRAVPVGFPVDMIETYRLGRATNTPARSFLLAAGGVAALGFSPEILAEVSADGLVRTQPLAGTRAFGMGAAEDAYLRAQLISDTKEIYEHAISLRASFEEMVALCQAGTVHVLDPLSVQERGTVQHLSSTVVGRVAPQDRSLAFLRMLFPAVTACGYPKRESCRAIGDLEASQRDLYAGTVMMLDNTGRVDAALVLRSLFQVDGHAWLRAGAGVVNMSRPEREYQETCEKLGCVAGSVVAAPPLDGEVDRVYFGPDSSRVAPLRSATG
jgi:salicylate synthetase